jgi:upstream activation factor subunit UAF30
MRMPTARKSSPKKPAAQKVPSQKKSAAPKRAPSPGLLKAMPPSAELAAIVGTKPLPRTEITKGVWDYIKRHQLQDSTNKRLINAEAKLQPVFGGKKQVFMFEMAKLVSRHLQ